MERKYAGFWIRLVAALIDGILLAVVSGIITYVLTQAMGTSGGVLGNVIQIVIAVAYYVFYQASAGQTLGKKALKIKVINEQGNTPTAFTFFLREIIGKFVSSIILGIGFIMIAFDSKKQGLHDKIAGTYVIKVD